MAKRGGTGILLELGADPDDEGDDWGDDGEGDDPEPEREARPRADAQSLIDEAERTLSELRALLSETG